MSSLDVVSEHNQQQHDRDSICAFAATDIECANGVIHVIDAVILPK